MKFEVYCDEILPDVLTSQSPSGRYMMIGSLWLPADLRIDAREGIKALKTRYGVHGEAKWRKLSPAKLPFYLGLIDLFFGYGADMRFRCIAIDRTQVNMAQLNGDAELGFYKFHYQVLHQWILDCNEYAVFCDQKPNRDQSRLSTLKTVLGHANRSSRIANVQAIPSAESSLLQLCDLLLGAAHYRLNERPEISEARKLLVERLEARLNVARLAPTSRAEVKFNVFKMRLQGGW